MPRKTEKEDSAIVSAAKAIGSAAGKVAALAGATPEAPAPDGSKPVKEKRGKFPKSNKSRLPRREKKAKQKSLGARSAG